MALDTKMGIEIANVIGEALNAWVKRKPDGFQVDADTLVATFTSQACMIIEGSPDMAGKLRMVRSATDLLVNKSGIDPVMLANLSTDTSRDN